MRNNLSFPIFIVVLLKEQTLCNSETNGKVVTGNREAFRHAVITKFTTLADDPIKLGIKLIEDTYAEESDNENINMLLTQILSDYNKINKENPTSAIEMFLRLSYIFDFVGGPISEKLQNRHVILRLKEALEEHNLNGVVYEFHRTYDDFLIWLIPEIAAYNNKLTTEEQQQVKEFKELCLQYPRETNLQNKLLVTQKIVNILEQ